MKRCMVILLLSVSGLCYAQESVLSSDDAMQEIDTLEAEHPSIEHIASLFTELEAVLDKLSQMLGESDEAHLIKKQLTDVIAALIQATLLITTCHLNDEQTNIAPEVQKIVTVTTRNTLLQTPATGPVKESTDEIVSSCVQMVNSLANIIASPKNRVVVGSNIASMITSIIRIICEAIKHKRIQKMHLAAPEKTLVIA